MNSINDLLYAAIAAGVPIVIDNRQVNITINGNVIIGNQEPTQNVDEAVLPFYHRSTLVDPRRRAEADWKTAKALYDRHLRAEWDTEQNQRYHRHDQEYIEATCADNGW